MDDEDGDDEDREVEEGSSTGSRPPERPPRSDKAGKEDPALKVCGGCQKEHDEAGFSKRMWKLGGKMSTDPENRRCRVCASTRKASTSDKEMAVHDDAGAAAEDAEAGAGGKEEIVDELSFHVHSCIEDETPHQIAKQYNVATKTILEVNKLRFPSLRQHSKLLGGTPVLVPLDALFNIYKAELDETPHKIGKKFNVAVKEVLALNKERLPQLTRHSKLFGETVILLPLEGSEYQPFSHAKETGAQTNSGQHGGGGGEVTTIADAVIQPLADDFAAEAAEDVEAAVSPENEISPQAEIDQSRRGSSASKSSFSVGVCPSPACRGNAEQCYLVTCRQHGHDNPAVDSGGISIMYLGGVLELEPKIRLEAQDYLGKWMPARIIELDPNAERALVHFDGWNKRFDEFISFHVNRMRPLPMQMQSMQQRGAQRAAAASFASGGSKSPSTTSAASSSSLHSAFSAAKKKQGRAKPIELNNLEFDHPGRKISGRPDLVDDVIVADWTCPKCTLVNASGKLTCSACFSNKPRVKAQKARRDSMESAAALAAVNDGSPFKSTGPASKRVKTSPSGRGRDSPSQPSFPCGPCGVQFSTVPELVAHIKLASHRGVVNSLTSSYNDFGDSHGEYVDADAIADNAAGTGSSSSLTTEQRESKANEKADKDFQRQLTLASSAASAWAAFAKDDGDGNAAGPASSRFPIDVDESGEVEADALDLDVQIKSSQRSSSGNGSGGRGRSKELMLPCAICKRVGDAGLQCKTCKAAYHKACVGAGWEKKMTSQTGDAECPKCQSSTVELCKCGSSTHKRTYSKECPLNPKNIQAKAKQESSNGGVAASAGSNGSAAGTAGGAGGFVNLDKDVAYGIVNMYRRLLQRVKQPGWEGKDVMLIGPDELVAFPQTAFLQHNRVVLEHPTVKVRAKATTLESMLSAAKKTKLEFRMKVRQTAAQILSELSPETLAAAGFSSEGLAVGGGGSGGVGGGSSSAGGSAPGDAAPGVAAAVPNTASAAAAATAAAPAAPAAPATLAAAAPDFNEDYGSDEFSDEELNPTELAEMAAMEEQQRATVVGGGSVSVDTEIAAVPTADSSTAQ